MHESTNPHSVSHFQACFHPQPLALRLLSQCHVPCSEMAGGIMDTLRATDIRNDPDGALVAGAKCGDRRAFEELIDRYKRRVFATALRMTNNREDAEDVVQESFHKAFLHLGKSQERSQFSTWLTR